RAEVGSKASARKENGFIGTPSLAVSRRAAQSFDSGSLVDRLLAPLLADRQDMSRHGSGQDRRPLDVKCAAVSEEPTPLPVPDVDRDPEPPDLVVIPLADLGPAAEQVREPDADQALVEALVARADPKPAI